MSRQSELAQLGRVFDTGPLSNRRLNQNGDMRVAQRGTGAVTPTSGSSLYPVDRWGAYANPSSKYSAQQQTGGPAGFDTYVRITSLSAHTSSSSDFFPFFTNLEGQDVQQLQYGSSDAKDVTISFWVRSSLTGNFSISFRAAVASTSYITTYTINVANTWEYKTITIAGNTSTSIANNNLLGFDVNFDLGHGSGNESTANTWIAGSQNRVAGTVRLVETNGATLDITGVQLEVGDTATPFEHRSYGDELARCQRYFYRQAGTKLYYRFGVGFCTSTTNGNNQVFFPVPMRTEVSLSSSGTFAIHHGTGPSVSTTTNLSIDTQGNGTQGITIDGTTTTLTTGNACQLIANNDSSAYIDYDAEL